MSGVVNRSVAEKAFAVKADELIRKPFQPQDLITRVRHLLNPKAAVAAAPPPAAVAASASAALSSIFAAAAPPPAARPTGPVPAPVPAPHPTFAPPVPAVAAPAPIPQPAPVAAAPLPPRPAPSTQTMDPARLKIEILRLEHLIKKLQSELDAEREYSRALEEHIKTLQESE